MKTLVAFFFALLLAATSAANGNGHGSGIIINNGGDTDAMAFAGLGGKVAEFLRNIGPSSPVSAQAFTLAWQNTWVEAVDSDLDLWAVPKDAINSHTPGIPGGSIRFNRQSWLRKSSQERTQLAVHEYLGIMGIDDQADSVSATIAQMYFRGLAGDDAKLMMRLMYAFPAASKTVDGHFVSLGPLNFSCARIATPPLSSPDYRCTITAPNSFFQQQVDGFVAITLYSLLEKTVSACTAPACSFLIDITCSSSSEDLHEAGCLSLNRQHRD